MSTTDLITILANVALTLSFIVAVIFGLAQIKASTRDRRERLTLETIRNFQTREFAELIFFVTTYKFPLTMVEFNQVSPKERIFLIQYAQQMESLGMQVAEGLINLDLIDKTLGSLVVTTWEKYKPVFTEMREKMPDPFLGEYYQWLAECIDKRMRENPRKPFHIDSSSAKVC